MDEPYEDELNEPFEWPPLTTQGKIILMTAVAATPLVLVLGALIIIWMFS